MKFFITAGVILMAAMAVSGCKAKQPPTQVVYRFDDHRYLELKGWNCEGELWYTDTLRGIHSQPYSQFYRIFTRKFVHPSERYLAITSWEADGFTVSKDYGLTWQSAQFSPGENEPSGTNRAPQKEVISLTVVNDQGFLQTKHRLYMSSKPFDDPRILPGGEGIHYQLEDGTRGNITPDFPGLAWGLDYITKQALEDDTAKYHENYQNLPGSVPEVKNYKGWDHMRCDMNAGT